MQQIRTYRAPTKKRNFKSSSFQYGEFSLVLAKLIQNDRQVILKRHCYKIREIYFKLIFLKCPAYIGGDYHTAEAMVLQLLRYG
jgi:hypothetical protein